MRLPGGALAAARCACPNVADLPRCTGAMPAGAFVDVVRTMALHHEKWDAQVGDTAALAPFPLVLSKTAWARLASMAAALARETLGMEEELSRVNRDTVFEAWAPRDGVWTPWAKAVLFAYVESVTTESVHLPRPTWLREELLSVGHSAGGYRASARERTSAVVVDLPGIEGVAAGLALADFGFRSVPLYNALPAPEAFVPMYDLIRTLVAGAEELARKPPPPRAPPAFLLDSRRHGQGLRVRGGFDNRSFAFPTDFPSVNRLRDSGIRAVILIQDGSDPVRPDLAEVLSGWQKEGLPIFLLRAHASEVAAPIAVRGEGLLGRISLWLWRTALKPDARGGFGARVPQGG